MACIVAPIGVQAQDPRLLSDRPQVEHAGLREPPMSLTTFEQKRTGLVQFLIVLIMTFLALIMIVS
jgi:hypothetical protein